MYSITDSLNHQAYMLPGNRSFRFGTVLISFTVLVIWLLL